MWIVAVGTTLIDPNDLNAFVLNKDGGVRTSSAAKRGHGAAAPTLTLLIDLLRKRATTPVGETGA